ncbi:chitinase [Streptomyces cyanogenus]|uniref:Bifunctional chitinase/lysozyme n=1 Tax=Streptomyces cyanogenus TaxID=80860 RepID=A0ABX7TND8_STRCY|nr:chitinase [Streptomyces cyanogenus]QTD98245.1 putative bifunctional chitinase/lysozyme precursor [Streptomyces cyanogenus]
MNTRIPRTALAALLPLTATAMLVGNGQPANAAAATSTWPAHFAAPYLQIGPGTVGDMADDMATTGLKHYTLAFLIPQNGCTAKWEFNGDPVGAFSSEINALKANGGDVIISFGGAAGGELAQTCTSVSDLTAAYADIVNTYGVTRLDFDIEGATLDDTAANTRRNQALAALQAQNPSVQVDYTLAVAPDGLPSAQTQLLQDAKDNGVNVSTVNLMTMDFGDGHNPLADAESAAEATARQLADIYGVSTSQAYQMMGLTPIAGKNDDDEVFSQADAATLENFAASNGVQELSFWEVDGYDKPTGYAYSNTFNQITTAQAPHASARTPRTAH